MIYTNSKEQMNNGAYLHDKTLDVELKAVDTIEVKYVNPLESMVMYNRVNAFCHASTFSTNPQPWGRSAESPN